MKNNNYSEKGFFFSKKGFYITAVIGILAVVAAAITLKLSTNKLKRGLSDITSSSAPSLSEVENSAENVPDPRQFTQTESETETTKEEATSEETETQKPSEKTEPQTERAAKIENTSYKLPMGTEIKKEFSSDTPVLSKTMGDYRTHPGVDFEGSQGAEVCAAGNGIVTRVLADTMWGYIVEIDHGDFTARYVGLDQGASVGIGDNVQIGQKIGTLAEIPVEKEDGVHLHFEVIKDGKATDPFEALGITR